MISGNRSLGSAIIEEGVEMRIFESHCHLDDGTYKNDLKEVVQRARKADVRAMMVVGINEASSRRAVAIAGQYQGVFASVGIHPHDAEACSETLIDKLRVMAQDPNVKAWGETGLDFNRMYSPQKDQEQWFIRQLQVGAEHRLPMIFHERDTQGRFLEILKAHWGPHRSGVVHCFSGDADELEAYLSLGLHIGVTGILTHKQRGRTLRRLVRRIPAERLVVETDAPYLTPSPERNKFRRNEPAFVRTVLFKLADVRKEDPVELAAKLWENTNQLFGMTDQR